MWKNKTRVSELYSMLTVIKDMTHVIAWKSSWILTWKIISEIDSIWINFVQPIICFAFWHCGSSWWICNLFLFFCFFCFFFVFEKKQRWQILKLEEYQWQLSLQEIWEVHTCVTIFSTLKNFFFSQSRFRMYYQNWSSLLLIFAPV